jgi:hypothetical protein
MPLPHKNEIACLEGQIPAVRQTSSFQFYLFEIVLNKVGIAIRNFDNLPELL